MKDDRFFKAWIWALICMMDFILLAAETGRTPNRNEVRLVIDVQIGSPAGKVDPGAENKHQITDVRVTQTPAPFSYAKNSLIKIILKENGADLKKREDLAKYKVELNGEEVKPESLTPLFRRDIIRTMATIEPDADHVYTLKPEKTGRKYTVTIKRYDSFEKRISEGAEGIVVYQNEFLIHYKYYLGLNAGLFFPNEKTGYSYDLHIKDPAIPADQARPTLTESVSYQVKVLVFTALYPFGFEPARKALDKHRVHFNLGTEISKSILERIYLGVGYDLTYMSINLFWSNGKSDVLPEEYRPYVNNEIPNPGIDSVPLQKINQNVIGISLSLPFNFAASLIGNLLGL
jgi:hypothetical protein